MVRSVSKLPEMNIFFRDCFCANDPGVNVTESSCNAKCSGDDTKICGGASVHTFASVYGTDL